MDQVEAVGERDPGSATGRGWPAAALAGPVCRVATAASSMAIGGSSGEVDPEEAVDRPDRAHEGSIRSTTGSGGERGQPVPRLGGGCSVVRGDDSGAEHAHREERGELRGESGSVCSTPVAQIRGVQPGRRRAPVP